MKAALDLRADAAHEDLREEIVEVVELLGGDPIGAGAVHRTERVREHQVHVADGDRLSIITDGPRSLPAHCLAVCRFVEPVLVQQGDELVLDDGEQPASSASSAPGGQR